MPGLGALAGSGFMWSWWGVETTTMTCLAEAGDGYMWRFEKDRLRQGVFRDFRRTKKRRGGARLAVSTAGVSRRRGETNVAATTGVLKSLYLSPGRP